MSTSIAVGVDGSEPSLIALRWAMDTAAIRGAHVVGVIATPPAQDRPRDSIKSVRRRRSRQSEQVERTRQAIEKSTNGEPLKIDVLEGTATGVLIDISSRVDMLVVGGHGYRGWRDALTPSVSGKLAVHTRTALCVVRVVPEPAHGLIVVGYDHRTDSSAVRFAADEAALRGAAMLLVSTWHYPHDTTATSSNPAEILQESAAAALREIVEEIRLQHPELPIRTMVQLGYPVEVLAELAESADLVVIGSRNSSGLLHGGLSGSLSSVVVGSVAIGLLRRVMSPVVVVPHD